MADKYISLREGARRLGISTSRFYKVLGSGLIGRVEYPGLSPRYSEADIEALRAKAVRSGPRVKIERSA